MANREPAFARDSDEQMATRVVTEGLLSADQVWSTLRQNGRRILGVGAFFALAVALVTLASHMEFKSSGQLYLGELESRSKTSGGHPTDLPFGSADPGDLTSEIQILQSTSLLARAILASGVNTSLEPSGWDPPRYWRWRLGHRDLGLLDQGLRELTPIQVQLDDDSRGPQQFTIKFLTPKDYEIWSAENRIGTGQLGTPLKAKGVTLTLLLGSQGKPATGSAYELKVQPLDQVVRTVTKALYIGYPKALTQGEQVRVITLEYSNGSPLLAQRLLRELMQSYLEERRSWKTEDASAAEDFVVTQLKLVRDSLDNVEQRLADYRTNHRVVVLDNEAKAMIEQIGKYEEQRVAARLQLAALGDMKRVLKNPDAQIESFLAGASSDDVLDGLTKTLSASQQDLASLEGRFSAAAPDVRQRRAEVDAQLAVIRNYVTTRHSRAQENLGALNQIISQFEEKLKTVPGAELGLAQLARESDVYSRIYSYLLERQQQTAIVKASTVSKNRILDAPQAPYLEASPTPLLRLVLALFGLTLATGAVLLWRTFATTLQTESDVQVLSRQVPIFASVPNRMLESNTGKLQPRFDILNEHPSSPFAESFRMLRANLYQRRAARNEGTVVLFTSPAPGDGKSTSAVALAVMLAADRKSVLLVDCDVRKPSHHAILRQSLEPGLSTVLTQQCDWLTAIQPVPASYGEFYAITAGRPAAAELLSSEVMATFLAKAKARFDFVLVDAASFPLVSDTLILSQYADCVVSVLRLRHTPKHLAVQHLRRLDEQVRDFGVLVNNGTVNDGYGSLAGYPGKRALRALATRQPVGHS